MQRSCGRTRLQTLRRICSGYRFWLSLSLMDTKMKLGGKSIPLPTDQRYAVNLFFTDYFPGSKKWRMSLKLALPMVFLCSTPQRAGDQQFPCHCLSPCRYRYELSAARQQPPGEEDLPEECDAGGRLPQPLRHRQRKQLLLGDRCNRSAIRRT